MEGVKSQNKGHKEEKVQSPKVEKLSCQMRMESIKLEQRTLRFFCDAPLLMTPSSSISFFPSSGVSRPEMHLRVVVLPQPDGPRRTTNSLFLI